MTRAGFDRDEMLGRLRDEQFDVLVLGGGVTGAGVALDAASRGLRTALVEGGDFAEGTSSRSSKMVHGGLRYLSQRELRLVYESLHERQRLLENAPHLVRPLPFLVPLFGRDGVLQKNVARAYSFALWTYDVTGGWRIGKRHRRIDRSEALAHLPTLRTDRLVAGFYYYDAWADDARLTLTIIRTAALEHGAAVSNYAKARGLLHDSSGKVRGALVSAWQPAGREPGWTDLEIRASVVVNATGVWADELRTMDLPSEDRTLRPAKGVHLTLPRSKLPADIAAVVPVARDKRSIFVVPWGDGDDVYTGTTDTAWDGPLDDPTCTPEDVEYLLGAINSSVSEPVGPQDVTGVWAGLRPLLRPPPGHHVSERTADLSRRHQVSRSSGNLITVTGGKLTTYRQMAEDTVDDVVAVLHGGDHRKLRCRTARLPLRGAKGLDELLEPGAYRDSGLSVDAFDALVHRHGSETPEVLSLASGRPELLEPLVPGLPQLKVEAVWAAREEMALTLEDVLSRRVRAEIRRAEAAARVAPDVASLLGPDWDRSEEPLLQEAQNFSERAVGSLVTAGVREAALPRASQGLSRG